jgi:YVTN family beta-propeller protein
MNHAESPNTISVLDTATDSVDPVPIPVGTGPSRIGFRPDSAFAYAINEGSNNISVIDAATRTVVNTLDVGMRPNGAAGCAAGPYGVVFNHGSNDVTIIDGTMNLVVATVPVGGEPLYGGFRPDCAFFFVITAADTVVAIDMTSLTTVATVPVGISPMWGTVRPDGAFLYVTNQGSNNVSVLDVTSPPFPVVATLTVGTAPVIGGIRPDGAYLFVVNQASNNVSVIDTTSNSVVGDIAVGNAPVFGFMRPDGGSFSVFNILSQDVSVIDTTTMPFTVAATMFFGWTLDPDIRVDFSADGNWVYLTNPALNTVLAGDLVNFVVADPIPVGNRPTHVAITPF